LPGRAQRPAGQGERFFPFGLRIFPFGLSLSKPCWKALVLAPFDRLRANGGWRLALRHAQGERFFPFGLRIFPFGLRNVPFGLRNFPFGLSLSKPPSNGLSRSGARAL
jgi:hypothetical protein